MNHSLRKLARSPRFRQFLQDRPSSLPDSLNPCVFGVFRTGWRWGLVFLSEAKNLL